MFVFEFEKPLFEFAYDRPHCAPLFALPPTFSSSTICCRLLHFPVELRRLEQPMLLFSLGRESISLYVQEVNP